MENQQQEQLEQIATSLKMLQRKYEKFNQFKNPNEMINEFKIKLLQEILDLTIQENNLYKIIYAKKE